MAKEARQQQKQLKQQQDDHLGVGVVEASTKALERSDVAGVKVSEQGGPTGTKNTVQDDKALKVSRINRNI